MYYRLYERLLNKFFEKTGKKHGVFGHIHTPRRGDNYTMVGSFYAGNIYENKDVVAFGDTHLGSFHYSNKQLKSIEKILERKDKLIILLGDIFDFIYSRPADLKKKFARVIELIKERQSEGNLVYIRGNHDWHAGEFFGFEVSNAYSIKDTIYFHGHNCDPLFVFFPPNNIYKIKSLIVSRLRWLKSVYIYVFS